MNAYLWQIAHSNQVETKISDMVLVRHVLKKTSLRFNRFFTLHFSRPWKKAKKFRLTPVECCAIYQFYQDKPEMVNNDVLLMHLVATIKQVYELKN